MRRSGKAVLVTAMTLVVLVIARLGSTFVVFAVGEEGVSVAGLLLGLAVLLGGGVVIGLLIDQLRLPRRAALIAGLGCLGLALLNVGSLLDIHILGAIDRSGPMAVLLAPLTMGLAIVLATALLSTARPAARISERRNPENRSSYPTSRRHTGWRDPPPGRAG